MIVIALSSHANAACMVMPPCNCCHPLRLLVDEGILKPEDMTEEEVGMPKVLSALMVIVTAGLTFGIWFYTKCSSRFNDDDEGDEQEGEDGVFEQSNPAYDTDDGET